MNYCGPSGITSDLERELKLDDRVFRFQTVKIAEDVDPQELIQKEKDKKKEPVVAQEAPPQPEVAVQDQGNLPEKEVSDHDG